MVSRSNRFLQSDGKVNERLLVEACRCRNGDALAFLIRHYRHDVEAGAVKAPQRYPNDHAHDPEDLGHDVFVRIIEEPNKRLQPSAGEIRDLHAWLQSLSLRLSLNELNSPRGSKGKIDAPFEFEELCDPSTDLDQLARVFGGLSDPSRRIVELSSSRKPDGKPYTPAEIAKAIGISLRTVYHKIKLIVARIRSGDLP